MPTRVYKYGCLEPTKNLDLFETQLRLSNRFYNKLIEIERIRRSLYCTWRAELVGDLVEAETAAQEVRDKIQMVTDRINAVKTETRSRSVPPKLRTLQKSLRADLKLVRERIKGIKQEAKSHPELVARAELLNGRAKTLKKAARQAFAAQGLFWGNYNAAADRAQAACKGSAPPKFRRYDGQGLATFQVQGGMPADTLFDPKEKRLSMDPLAEDTWSTRPGRRHAHGVLRFRIGSDENRGPVFVEVPILVHRRIPPEAVIKTASLHRVKVGLRWDWHVTFTATLPEVAPSINPGVLALDLGWRRKEDGSIRVAYWTNTFGEHGEVTVPAKVVGALTHSRDLKSILDTNLNEILPVLAEVRDGAPDWYLKQSSHVKSWRSSSRVYNLVKRWRARRWTGDERAFAAAEHWLHRYKHLYQWSVDEARKAAAYRTDTFRRFAKWATESHGTIVIEDLDIAQMARLAAPEDQNNLGDTARRQRVEASPGELRQALSQAAAKSGCKVVATPAAGTSRQCSYCGHDEKWEERSELLHMCENCGMVFDRDLNAARNILRRESEGAVQDWRPESGEKSKRQQAREKASRKGVSKVPESEAA